MAAISLTQLSASLTNKLAKLYCIEGDETLLVQEANDLIRQQAKQQNFSERSVFNVTGGKFDWSQVLLAAQAQSLFTNQQIIEIRIPNGKPGKDGANAIKQLMQFIPHSPNLFIICLPKLDRTSKNSVWFKAIEQNATIVNINKITRNELPQWIAQRIKQQQQHLPSGVEQQQILDFFSNAVEGNLLAAHQEIQKLLLLFGSGATLTFDQIKDSVLNVARFDIFRLTEAILGGQPQQVDKILKGLKEEGETEVLVHWAIAEDIRVLQKIKNLQQNGSSIPAALKQLRVWGLKEKLMERLASRITSVQASNLLQSAHIVDGIIKGIYEDNWPKNSWQALHKLAMQVCQFSCIPPQIKRY